MRKSKDQAEEVRPARHWQPRTKEPVRKSAAVTVRMHHQQLAWFEQAARSLDWTARDLLLVAACGFFVGHAGNYSELIEFLIRGMLESVDGCWLPTLKPDLSIDEDALSKKRSRKFAPGRGSATQLCACE